MFIIVVRIFGTDLKILDNKQKLYIVCLYVI